MIDKFDKKEATHEKNTSKSKDAQRLDGIFFRKPAPNFYIDYPS